MAKFDAAERLLNLIIALSNARGRMTRAEIRETVAGYDPAVDADTPEEARKRTAAFERMFERDKDDLRRMGVPLRTVTDATHGDDIGYVIDRGEAAMPPVELSPAQRAIVAVAAAYWQDAALGMDARRALVKVASWAPRLGDVAVPLAARSSHGADAAPALAQAIADGQAVAFTYTSAASGRRERAVEPWRLIVDGGAVYLVGLDREVGAARTYRLSRMEGPVRTISDRGAFVAPSDVPGIVLEAEVPSLTARMGLRAECGHMLRRRGTFVETVGEWDVFDVPYSDTDALRDDVLTLVGAARVFSPESLARAVAQHAEAALEVAGG